MEHKTTKATHNHPVKSRGNTRFDFLSLWRYIYKFFQLDRLVCWPFLAALKQKSKLSVIFQNAFISPLTQKFCFWCRRYMNAVYQTLKTALITLPTSYLPKVFVATKCQEIKWLDLSLNIADVQRKENGHNLHKEPHQGWAGCDAQLFWSKSGQKTNKQTKLNYTYFVQ